MIYLMNTATLPVGSFGTYTYRPARLSDLRAVVRGERGEWTSVLGYALNCDLIEKWTGVRPPVNRARIYLSDGDSAFVMRVRAKLPMPISECVALRDNPRSWEFAWITYRRTQ